MYGVLFTEEQKSFLGKKDHINHNSERNNIESSVNPTSRNMPFKAIILFEFLGSNSLFTRLYEASWGACKLVILIFFQKI